MYRVELYAQVRRSVFVEGLSEREAAKRFGLARGTVRKMLRYATPPGYRRRQPAQRPKLDPFTGIVDQILIDDQERPKKQRHTAKRIFDRLRDEYDFTGGYTIVKDYVRDKKLGGQEMFVPLVHPPLPSRMWPAMGRGRAFLHCRNAGSPQVRGTRFDARHWRRSRRERSHGHGQHGGNGSGQRRHGSGGEGGRRDQMKKPQIKDAGAEYAEIWGEAIHTNRHLRVISVGLAIGVLLLIVVVIRIVSVEPPRPIVVRVDEVGRAEAVAYKAMEAQADPLDPTTKYFLNRFIYDFYSRRRATVAQNWSRSLRFLSTQLANASFRADSQNVALLAAGVARGELQVARVILRI